MAVEASLTGHLVLSTLHTNTAPETVTRLLDMGLDAFNFADSLLGVINEILDFSKVESGRLDLDQVEFSVAEIIGDCMKTMALRAHEKELELAYQVSSMLPEKVMGDPARLRQVIINLVGNAIKFTPQGEVVLQVQPEAESEDEVQLHFCLRDRKSTRLNSSQQHDAQVRRYRTGAGDLFTAGAVDGRTNLGGERAGARQQIPVHRALRQGKDDLTGKGAGAARGTGGVAGADRRRQPHEPAHPDGNDCELGHAGLHGGGWRGGAGSVAGSAGAAARHTSGDHRRQHAWHGWLRAGGAGQAGPAARCRQVGISAYLLKPISKSELLLAIRKLLGHVPAAAGAPAGVFGGQKACLGLRILVAEDNAVNQALIMRVLEKMGHKAALAKKDR